ncbi:MAG: hypothetical protein LIO80_00365 [Lachnospiraceae bacterium]|nr:hypothetical protein [Lachnospiraceae bacterium]
MAGNKDYKEMLGKLDEMMVELQYDLTGEEFNKPSFDYLQIFSYNFFIR